MLRCCTNRADAPESPWASSRCAIDCPWRTATHFTTIPASYADPARTKSSSPYIAPCHTFARISPIPFAALEELVAALPDHAHTGPRRPQTKRAPFRETTPRHSSARVYHRRPSPTTAPPAPPLLLSDTPHPTSPTSPANFPQHSPPLIPITHPNSP